MKFEPIDIILKNGKKVTIREATSHDAEKLIIAAKSYLRESDYLLSYDEEFNPTKKEEIAWIKSHDNINSLLLVTTYNKEIISTFNVTAFHYQKLSHVANLGISMTSEWRGMGLGSALFESMINWAKSKSNLEIITLEVFSANLPAIHLYEKYGFVKDGEKENYFKDKNGNYYNNILMSLKIK